MDSVWPGDIYQTNGGDGNDDDTVCGDASMDDATNVWVLVFLLSDKEYTGP